MMRALDLGKSSLGLSSPNPPVGALIEKNGVIIGQGFTQEAGGDHAEVVALRDAGEEAYGATMYVTMEPCSHFGKTPPCTEAVINAGIKEVHMAILDPNPLVNGKGKQSLIDKGIEVYSGENVKEAEDHFQGYFKFVKTGKPLVIVKYAMTLDGKTATRIGDSKWITGAKSRELVHEMRGQMDAILTAPGTIMSDDPRLNARDSNNKPFERQPIRVIVDSHGRTPKDASIFKEPGDIIIFTAGSEAALKYEDMGENVSTFVADDRFGRVNLEIVLKKLGDLGVVQLMTEAGGTLIGALFDRELPDQVVVFIGPSLVGGVDAPAPVEGLGLETIKESFQLKDVKVDLLDSDIVVKGLIRSWA